MASNIHCVISTLSPEKMPQSALVGFSEDSDMRLVIGTYKNSRKWHNIASNPHVSVVIADEHQKLEVQYEGSAKLVTVDELSERLKMHFQKLPGVEKRINDPNQAWISIEPTWVRYVDASASPIQYEEMSIK